MVERSAKTVLHVSEAFGGGIVSAVRAHVGSTPEFRHLLAFSDRREAPLSGHDLDPFDAIVTLPHEPRAAIRIIRRAVRKHHVDIVHAHSAIGGALARLALRTKRIPIVYSPHCLPHLREDRSAVARRLFRTAERTLASNTAMYVACSPFELAECATLGPSIPRTYVPNALTAADYPPLADPEGRPHLLGVGRLFPQKDPEFFAASVEAVRTAGIDIAATWIGDGESHLRDRLESAGVEVTGWLPREESLRRLAQPGGIYLHSARWEGFPFAILEAHAAELPMIIRHIDTLADFSFPFEVREPHDVAQAVKELLASDARTAAVAAADIALAENKPDLLRERLLAAYEAATS